MATVGLAPTPARPLPADDDEDAREEEMISKFINEAGMNGDAGGAFAIDDATGKADDAVDYEDISDDDLPAEDELPSTTRPRAEDTEEDEGGAMAAGGDLLAELAMDAGGDEPMADYDDLFGDMSDPAGPIDDADVDLDLGGVMDYEFEDGGDGAAQNMFRDIDFGVPELEIQASPEDLAKQFFPDFKPHAILSFSSLFRPKPGFMQTAPSKVPKVCVPSKLSVEMAPDDSVIFSKGATAYKGAVGGGDKGIVHIQLEESDSEDAQEDKSDDAGDPQLDRDVEMACDDWEARLEAMAATPPPTPPPQREQDELGSDSGEEEEVVDNRIAKRPKLDHRYLDAVSGKLWDDEAIFNGDLSALAAKAIIDMNDPHLLLDIRKPNEINRKRRIGGEFKRRVNRDLTQRYNISNDEAYDLLKENHQNKIRSTIGQLNIEHSLPALKLQTPYYKAKLSTKEARSFHRPSLHFHIDQTIRFSKIKTRKRKTYKNKDIKEILNTTESVSLKDGLDFVLLEYSEEYPLVMSNFGMGSRLINYYRRKGPDDESRPKLDIGETQVLMSQDRSPFWNFGTVDPGETVPTLYNKMVRAPIFKQNPKSTDFLVIRNSQNNQSHYYMRTIPYLYVVGQLLPVCEVPGPHSRRVTTASKNRLKMICYRVVKRKNPQAIAVKDVSAHFPDSSDMQNRQKMKEFMSFMKQSGMWEMKPGEPIPDESQIRTLVKPEELCLLEAMQVGVRNLEDAGYTKALDDDDDTSLETQLAPWTSTKNFLHATQGKAMLQLHGEGDPTGRGEAFSFVRTSMKGGFKDIGESIDEKMDKQRLKELGGHSYNVARQQKMYEEAIDRIWRSQYRSLSSTEEQQHDDLDMDRDDNGEDLVDDRPAATPHSEASPWIGDLDDSTSQFSRMSTKSQRNKVLRITRKFLNEYGELESKVEVVRDPKVIRQYLQKRRELEAEKTQVESLVPTGNDEEDAHARKRLMEELQRLQRCKERREARQRQGGRGRQASISDVMSPEALTPGSPMAPPPMPTNGKTATARRCANCGQTGHIKTNKKVCPKLNGRWKELGMSPPRDFAPAPPTPSVSTPQQVKTPDSSAAV